MRTLLLIFACSCAVHFNACGQSNTKTEEQTEKREVMKTDKEWKNILTKEEYEVLRNKGTERAYTGKYYDFDEEGVYVCAACGNPLFSSEEKYSSGSGWPSFYDVLKKGNVETKKDMSMGWERTEVVCSRCGSHLGHVFEDGPEPTGLRYCVNSVSLDFKPEDETGGEEDKNE